MYKVETILDKKIDIPTKKELYLVKWENYSYERLTWEPLENLQENCSDVIAEFEAKYGNLKTTRFGKVRVPSPLEKKEIHERIDKKKIIKKQAKRTNRRHLHQNQKSLQPSQGERQHSRDKITKFTLESRIIKQDDSRDKQQESQFNQKNEKKSVHLFKQRSKNQNIFPLIQDPKRENYDKKPDQFDNLLEKNNKIMDKKEIIIQQDKQIRPQFRWNESVQLQGNKFSIEAQNVKVLGMKKNQKGHEFYIQKSQIKGWCTHSFVINHFPRELCSFYQRHIQFQ